MQLNPVGATVATSSTGSCSSPSSASPKTLYDMDKWYLLYLFYEPTNKKDKSCQKYTNIVRDRIAFKILPQKASSDYDIQSVKSISAEKSNFPPTRIRALEQRFSRSHVF